MTMKVRATGPEDCGWAVNWLDQMSGQSNAALWTREALGQHEAWRQVRALAMTVLCTLA